MKKPQAIRKGYNILIPGLATVHSHAFQRAMRGLTQQQTQQAGSFWSWRGLMYQLAGQLDPDDIYAIARLAYLELMMSGVTLVGEFHYVHHQPDGTPYANRTAMADAVVEAARSVGMRICLIRTAYLRGGYEQALTAVQQRFSDASIDLVLQDVETLQSQYVDEPLVSVALAAHSVRAVPISDIQMLSEWAAERQLPFHMHVSEQRRELAECEAEYGMTPVRLLAEHGVLNERFTAVHATHLTKQEVTLLGQHRCFVNLCRTTERDLGDGLPETAALVQAGARLCVGVDSHCGENAFEELRAVELDARTQHEARTVVGDGAFLLDAGTRQGFAACGMGDLWQQDQVLLDGKDLALVGLPDERLVDGVVFNGTPRAVKEVWVDGEQVIVDGRHPQEKAIIEQYLKVVSRLVP